MNYSSTSLRGWAFFGTIEEGDTTIMGPDIHLFSLNIQFKGSKKPLK